jgi:hypothetical protein
MKVKRSGEAWWSVAFSTCLCLFLVCVVGNGQDVAYFMLKRLWQRLKQGINCDDVVKEELSIQYSIGDGMV